MKEKTGAFAGNEVLCKGVRSLGKEGSARGEEPLFKAVCSSRIFYKKRFVLCTTSVSPLDRDKDTVLDPRKMLAHFSVLGDFTGRLFCAEERTAFPSGFLRLH